MPISHVSQGVPCTWCACLLSETRVRLNLRPRSMEPGGVTPRTGATMSIMNRDCTNALFTRRRDGRAMEPDTIEP